MKGIVVLVLMVLVGSPTWGQTVIVKCKDAKGGVIYQTSPCLSSAKQSYVSAKQYGAVHDDPAAASRVRQAQREVDARRATYGGNAQGAYIANDRRGAACESAKAHREAVLKAAGMRRNFNLLRSLDESVQRACK